MENLKNENFYHRHYIKTDDRNRIVDGWSDGVFPDRDTTDAICINERGGYQFCLYPSGDENPLLYADGWIHMYKWDGEAVQKRTEEEIAADREALPAPPPSEQEKLRADVDFLAALQGVIL